MGLFETLGIGGSPEQRHARAVAKLQKKALEKYGQPDIRQEAIEELGAMKTAQAADALLMRYTVRVDPGITDDEEKQRIHELTVQMGKALAVPALTRFVRSRDEVSWPLKSLAEILSEAELVDFLIAALEQAAREYSRVPEKKILLLDALAHHKDSRIVATAKPFLSDMDDAVQISAARAIAAQAQGEGSEPGREAIIQHFLAAHQSSNMRVRESLAGILAESPWDVKGYTPSVEQALPEAYKLDSRAKVVAK